MIALASHRYRFRGKALLDAVMVMNIAASEVVMGAALLTLFIAGNVPFGALTIVLAQVMFSIPFVAITVRARLVGVDNSLEAAAQALGSRRGEVSGGGMLVSMGGWQERAMATGSKIAELVNAASSGDATAQDAAYALVYDELKRCARRQSALAQGSSLSPTALVNELYLKLRAGRGANDFGVDPLFCDPTFGSTLAEAPGGQNLQVSHRGKALRALWQAVAGIRDSHRLIK